MAQATVPTSTNESHSQQGKITEPVKFLILRGKRRTAGRR